MSQNRFSKVMAKKSDSELERVVNSPSTFAEEARLAAAQELQNRGTVTKKVAQIGFELETKLEEEQDKQKFNDKFISKNWIYGLVIFFTPLIIGPYLAVNIWNHGKRKGVWTVLFISFIYLPLIFFIIILTPQDLWRFVLSMFHLGYVAFYVEWVWSKYLPTYEEYKNEQNGSQH